MEQPIDQSCNICAANKARESHVESEDYTSSHRLSESTRQEIVDEVYNRFYRQVGSSAIRCVLYVCWAALVYAVYKLAAAGWFNPKG